MERLNVNKFVSPIDYTHSNINLISSILNYYGVKTEYNGLESLNTILNKKYTNVCLIILDGLGDNILTHHSEFGVLNESKIDVIDSVFPPTTVAAIDTFESGVAPIEHGYLGWRMYFKEYDRVLDVFTGNDSVTGELITTNHQKVIEYEQIYSKIKKGTFDEVKCHEIYPDYIKRKSKDCFMHSVNNLSEFFDKISDIVNLNNKEKFIYAYWPDPDHTLHEFGTKSEVVQSVIEQIEEEFEKCIEVCEDTLFIIAADHGLIDINPICLNDYPEIINAIERYPDIDSRCMNFKIKDGFKEDFKTNFLKYFSTHHILLDIDEVLNSKLFGLGKAHPNCKEVFGDFLAIATSNETFVVNTQKPSFEMKASHAGLTKEEIKVPLIVFEKHKDDF